MPRRRFAPIITTPGLEPHLKARRFAGLNPEDGMDCRVATWRHASFTTVLLSPGAHDSGAALAAAFDQVANHFYIEMLARRLVNSRSAIRWVQHWPGRAGAPAPCDVDHFENVQLRPTRGRLELQARQLLRDDDALEGLLGSAAASNLNER